MKAEKQRDIVVAGALIGRLSALMVLALLLAGCPDSDKSTEFPVDERELTNPVQNWDRDTYRGRVMNGNLQDAVVWLDMESNGKLSPGDPWGWSDENGEFELDVAEFRRDPSEGRSLDPRDYPLMAVAIAGHTRDQHTNEMIDHAFFLMAPPGRRLISPFTTLVEARRRLPFVPATTSAGNALERSATDVRRRMSSAEEEISVLQDYRRSQTPRAPFYAEALRRFIQAQVPGTLSEEITKGTDTPQVSAFAREDLQVIGTLMLDQIGAILEEVDELIPLDDVDGFTLLEGDLNTIVNLGPDLTNPYVLRDQLVYLPPPEGSSLSLDASNVESRGRIVARVLFDYTVSTSLRRIEVLGESAPSLPVLAMLLNEGGVMADFGRQPWLDVVLDEDNINRADSDVLESFIGEGGHLIPWSQFEIGLDSAIIAHSPVSVLDGVLDRRYQVPEGGRNGRVTQLERILPHHNNGGDVDASLSVSYGDDGNEQPVNVPLAFAGAADIAVSFGPVQYLDDHDPTCHTPDVDSPLVVNARQSITITSDDPELEGVLTRYGHLRDEFGDKVQEFRVLLEEFVPVPANNPQNERREFEYFDDSGTLRSDTQPDLLRSVRIFLGDNAAQGNRFCDNTGNTGGDSNNTGGKSRRLEPNDLDAYIGFEYLPFSDYLEQQGSTN